MYVSRVLQFYKHKPFYLLHEYGFCLIQLWFYRIVVQNDNNVVQLCKRIVDFLLMIVGLLYSLPPSVGQSAAELRQVTSEKTPECTQGCFFLFHLILPLDVESFNSHRLQLSL